MERRGRAPSDVPPATVLKVVVDQTDPFKLHVDFPNTANATSRWAIISATVVTDVGEWLNTTFEVASFCPGTNDAVAFDRQLPHVYYDPGDPGPADIALRRVLQEKGYPLDLDGLPEGARKNDRTWVTAYAKWRTGERLTTSDRKLLVDQVVAGRKLASAKKPGVAVEKRSSEKAAQRHAGAVRSAPSSDRAPRVPDLAKGPTSPLEGMSCSRLAQGLTYTRSDKKLTLECKVDSEHQPRWQRR